LVNAEYLPNFEVCVSVGNFERCSCWASDVLTFGKLMVTTVWQTVLGQWCFCNSKSVTNHHWPN